MVFVGGNRIGSVGAFGAASVPKAAKMEAERCPRGAKEEQRGCQGDPRIEPKTRVCLDEECIQKPFEKDTEILSEE